MGLIWQNLIKTIKNTESRITNDINRIKVKKYLGIFLIKCATAINVIAYKDLRS